MLKKMKRRFVLAAMASITAVVLLLLAGINLWNCRETTRRTDRILSSLMEASLTGGEPFKDQEFPPETPFTARFFLVRLDGAGDVLELRLDSISAVSEEKAAGLAQAADRQGGLSGYLDNYRYLASRQETGSVFLFLDVSNELEFMHTLLVISCAVAAVSLLAVFGLLVLFSGRVAAPYVRNAARQKQFITDASHEIKTPLTSISTSADILSMDLKDNEWVANIQKQSARLSRLVTDLVTLSRLDEERPIPEPVRFSLSDTAWEMAEPFSAMAKAKGRRFSCSIEDGLFITGDPSVIQQLFSILLDNAVKYSQENGAIYFHVYKRKKDVAAEVFNTCGSLDGLDVTRLFDRFYRPDTSRSSHTGGTGIGLSIARAAAAAHGGSITASCPGAHSILFQVILPE